MSTSTSAFGLAAHQQRRSSRKAIPNHVLGSAAVACLVLGCAWSLHANVFGASVYPRLGSADFDAPVVKRSMLAVRSTLSPADSIVAALPEPAPVISAPASIPSRPLLSFDDRFAAAAPQSVEPAAPAPKLAEAARPKETSPSSVSQKVAAIAPAPPPRAAEAPSQQPGSYRSRHGAARQGGGDVDRRCRAFDRREALGQAQSREGCSPMHPPMPA